MAPVQRASRTARAARSQRIRPASTPPNPGKKTASLVLRRTAQLRQTTASLTPSAATRMLRQPAARRSAAVSARASARRSPLPLAGARVSAPESRSHRAIASLLVATASRSQQEIASPSLREARAVPTPVAATATRHPATASPSPRAAKAQAPGQPHAEIGHSHRAPPASRLLPVAAIARLRRDRAAIAPSRGQRARASLHGAIVRRARAATAGKVQTTSRPSALADPPDRSLRAKAATNRVSAEPASPFLPAVRAPAAAATGAWTEGDRLPLVPAPARPHLVLVRRPRVPDPHPVPAAPMGGTPRAGRLPELAELLDAPRVALHPDDRPSGHARMALPVQTARIVKTAPATPTARRHVPALGAPASPNRGPRPLLPRASRAPASTPPDAPASAARGRLAPPVAPPAPHARRNPKVSSR